MTAALQALQLIAFLAAVACAVYCFGYAVSVRIRYIGLGRPDPPRPAGSGGRLDSGSAEPSFAAQVFGHRKLLNDRKSGVMHLVLFYGFLLLQLGAIDLIGQGLSREWRLPLGPLYPYFALQQEITVILVLAAIAYAAYRRYGEKLPRLKRNREAATVVLLIGGLMLSVALTNGFKLAWDGGHPSLWHPVASAVAACVSLLPEAAAGALFYIGWWLHLLILLAFLVYVPQSKHAHILFAPLNLYGRRKTPRLPETIDFDTAEDEQFGAGSLQGLTKHQLLDLYACVECGRCSNVCPATGTGKTLSPMQLITNLRDHLNAVGQAVTSRSPWMPAAVFAGKSQGTLADPSLRMVGDVVTQAELWACTTCRNCEDQCPVGNEHVSMIIDMRRHLTMTEGDVPGTAARVLQNLERQGNPWGLSRHARRDWIEELRREGAIVPEARSGEPFELLFYVGSMGSYDTRAKSVTKAVARLLEAAGCSYAVMGEEEWNSGDTARRLGQEYLYQESARETIERFKKFGVRRIVTADPHAYHAFRNEYADLGMPDGIEVLHHTELLASLVREGRLVPAARLDAAATYHDSCYLGRYNGKYGPAREVLRAIPGLELREMERSGPNAMCCGAGGGLMWMEETEGTRIHTARAEQAVAVAPDVVATACPYCLTMMRDGLTHLQRERIETRDIAELLARSVFGPADA